MNNVNYHHILPKGTPVMVKHKQGWYPATVDHYLADGTRVHCNWDWNNPPWDKGTTVPNNELWVLAPVLGDRNYHPQDRINYAE